MELNTEIKRLSQLQPTLKSSPYSSSTISLPSSSSTSSPHSSSSSLGIASGLPGVSIQGTDILRFSNVKSEGDGENEDHMIDQIEKADFAFHPHDPDPAGNLVAKFKYPSPVVIQSARHSNLVLLIWRHIDPRKPNRQRKLTERVKTKLNSATSKQVHQILTFNRLLTTLNKYQSTLDRFQDNSLRLHRCLIKWDKLKSRDQSFTRTSVLLSIDLQRFIQQMADYFGSATPTHSEPSTRGPIRFQTDVTTTETDSNDSLLDLDEGFVEVDRPRAALEPIGIRKQLLIKYRLGQLRFKTRKFNQRFEIHEQKKIELKLRGNQCILDMVTDGKKLVEINEEIVELVFELSLLRM